MIFILFNINIKSSTVNIKPCQCRYNCPLKGSPDRPAYSFKIDWTKRFWRSILPWSLGESLIGEQPFVAWIGSSFRMSTFFHFSENHLIHWKLWVCFKIKRLVTSRFTKIDFWWPICLSQTHVKVSQSVIKTADNIYKL